MRKLLRCLVLPAVALLLVAPFGVFFPALGAYNPATLVGIATVTTLEAGNYIPYPYIYLVGYSSFGDGGEGVLAYKSGIAANNGCTVFNDTAGHVFHRLGASAALNVDQCGAVGNETADDSAAFANAFAASQSIICSSGKTYKIVTTVTVSTANTSFSQCRLSPHLSPSSNPMLDIEASGFLADHIYAKAGSGGWLFFIGTSGSISNISLTNITCDGSDNAPMSGCITLGAVTNFRLDRWTDASSGYGLLQKSGTNSHDILVSNFYASDMYADLIEENSVTGVSTNWRILHGTFDGSHGYPSPATEERFAGFTTTDAYIQDVYVQHANGDSAVHLEGTATLDIDHSWFGDNQISGGSDGNITAHASGNNITATNVTCLFDGTPGNAAYCIAVTATGIASTISATNVQCIDTSGMAEFGCFDLSLHTGQVTINGGGGSGLLQYILVNTTIGPVTVSGTTVSAVDEFYNSNLTGSGQAATGVTLTGNNWICSAWCVVDERKSTGTYPVYTVVGNHFAGPTSSDGVDIVACNSCNANGNWYSANFAYHSINDSGVNTSERFDVLDQTGGIHPCTVSGGSCQ